MKDEYLDYPGLQRYTEHVQGEIDQLNSSLAGKSNTGHTHYDIKEYTVTLGTVSNSQVIGTYYASLALDFTNGVDYHAAPVACFLSTNAAMQGIAIMPSGSKLLYVNGAVSGGTYKVQIMRFKL